MSDKLVIFTGPRLGTTFLRGRQVAEALGAKFLEWEQLSNITGAVVFAIKMLPMPIYEALKNNDNTVVFDPLDCFCRKDNPEDNAAMYFVDHVIYSTLAQASYWGEILGAPHTVIPHHWDARLNTMAKHDQLEIGYVGASFNHGAANFPVPGIYHNDLARIWAPRFNCHWNIRDPHAAKWKPATKVVTAAAVGANIITIRDPGSEELLGADYPYYVDDVSDKGINKALDLVYNDFYHKRDLWESARDIMLRVRESTSLHANLPLYRQIIEHPTGGDDE